ncbi:ComC/BlpC family leader-containing pheromone/bacteriocin [Streptococcus sobrinus]|uniref:ComC/BlpC family leader-containing pheromone/bacteriocin n=1 Tax=Streptococcus sobrinus TaxID=1310 RepID=UPI0002DA3569|nr:ComC/BlpC family leader-containing pheromone/bacteriocin [Streptococcus sobrinus]
MNEITLDTIALDNFNTMKTAELAEFEGGTNWEAVIGNLVTAGVYIGGSAMCVTPLGAGLAIGAAAIHMGLAADYCYQD